MWCVRGAVGAWSQPAPFPQPLWAKLRASRAEPRGFRAGFGGGGCFPRGWGDCWLVPRDVGKWSGEQTALRFFARAWRPGLRGPRGRTPARGGGEVSGLRLPQRHPAVPTCSRRFCQRPHGLSSRMSLSSSLSSSRSRSRPRLGAGSGAAMALSVQAAALRAIRRGRRSLPAPAPRTGAQPGAEPPRPRSPTQAAGTGRRRRAAEGWTSPAAPEQPPRAGARVELLRGSRAREATGADPACPLLGPRSGRAPNRDTRATPSPAPCTAPPTI